MENAEQQVWRSWQEWDEKRYANNLQIYETTQAHEEQHEDATKLSTSCNDPMIPKKKRSIRDSDTSAKSNTGSGWHSTSSIPKKKRSTQSLL